MRAALPTPAPSPAEPGPAAARAPRDARRARGAALWFGVSSVGVSWFGGVVLAAAGALPRQGPPAAAPDDARALDALGQWQLAHGHVGAARAATGRALALRPADALVLLHLGEIELLRAGVPGQAARLADARAALERSRTDPAVEARACERLAEIDALEGKSEDARTHLEAALRREPSSARAQARLGRAELELGALARARTAFERATELDPRASDAWSGLGRVRFLQDAPNDAAELFRRALALEPDLIEANALLGRIQETHGAKAEAELAYRRALAVAPDRPDALQVDTLYALGALLSSAGRGDEALRYLERVVELRPDPPHVRAHLESARLHLARGEPELARARVEAVLRANPAQPEARALLERLEPGPGPR